MLDGFPKAQVYILKSDGTKNGPISATKTPKMIVVQDPSLDVQEGDHVTHTLPNGNEEVFLITSANYFDGMAGMPAHFQLHTRKTTAISEAAAKPSPTINIHNSTGIQIGDHNVQHIQAVLSELAEKISNSSAPADQKTEARNRLSAFLAHPATVAVLGASATILAAKIQAP